MSILTIADFGTGKFELSTGMYDLAKIQEYIDKYEKKYLLHLLGAELYAEFNADLIAGGGYPTEQRFIDIWEPFEIDYSLEIIISEGIKEMLRGFIYFEYVKDLENQITPAGMVKPMPENSENPGTLFSLMYTRYNDGCKTYKSIQKRICIYRSDYVKFNGKHKSFVYWI